MSDSEPRRPWIDSYAAGVPAELPPISGSLSDIVAEAARLSPAAPAIEFFGHTLTYHQLVDEIDRVAGGLSELGVTAGTHVALVLPNCPQHVVAFYAVARLGAVVIEHNPLYTPEELEHIFSDHRADIVIAWDKVVSAIQSFSDDIRPATIVSVDLVKAMPAITQLALHLPMPRLIKTRRQLHEKVRDTVPWSSLLKSRPVGDDVPRPQTDDLAVIQYTSGTTGRAKGVELTHRNLMANALQCALWGVDEPRGAGAVVYGVLPMFHAYGLTLCATVASSLRARLVLFPKFDPDMVLDAHVRHPATLFPLVPPIAQRLMSRAKERSISLSGIRLAISGAMPLPLEIIEPWETATGGIMVEGYGLSECAPILMINPFGEGRVGGSAGLPVPGTDVRLVDPDEPTREVPAGERGELVVRGPQVFRRYYNLPNETEAAFADGWFRTGDIATIDERGYVRIVDRIKELIITGGFNVMPSEVEAAITKYPGVHGAAVVGLPDSHSGEEVVAAVLADVGADLDLEALREHLRDSLAAYKVPRRLFVIDDMPVSQIGKVLRRVVRQQLIDMLESGQ